MFGNPVYDGQMELVPCEVRDDKEGQLYSEPWTGQYMYRIQVS